MFFVAMVTLHKDIIIHHSFTVLLTAVQYIYLYTVAETMVTIVNLLLYSLLYMSSPEHN